MLVNKQCHVMVLFIFDFVMIIFDNIFYDQTL